VAAALAVLVLASWPAQGAEPIKVKGAVVSVTLYRGQALVTRVVPVAARGKGAVHLVVSDLPERVRSDSLYASADKGTHVRAVRYRTRVVTEAPRAEVREIEKAIEAVNKETRKNAQEQNTLSAKLRYLDKLESFVASTAKVELSKGVLNADTLKTLTEFTFEQRTKLGERSLAVREAEQELREKLNELQRKRSLLTRGASRSEREAVVFLDKTEAGATRIRLSYVVDGASWSPAYNLRATTGKDRVEVEYDAVITQMSGEDWHEVELALSTASPSMTADAPMLAPLLVSLRPRMEGAELLARVRRQFSEASTQVRKHEQRRQKALDRGGQIEAQWWLNKAAHGFQVWELYVPEPLARVARDMTQREVSGLSVNYTLKGRQNVDSRQEQQIVRIADLSLPARFTAVAVPLLTEQVYRRATVTNNSELALLEGRGNVYLDGDFVGVGTLPVVASGQRFLAGFGVDAQLRTRRELVSKKERIQGANREVTYDYRLELDNYGEKERTVQLYDRIPYAQEEIRVTELDGFNKLSEDEEYRRVFRPRGILRWDVPVPAKQAGPTAKTVVYSFKLEYDRNKDIAAATQAEREAKIKALFEKQLRGF
jgi:uncharacterized protein (TIGR02231 family)